MAVAVAGLGLALSPLAAHAMETLSATGQGWGVENADALANAESNAYFNLYDLARSHGETCTNITYTTINFYPIPGPPYGFEYEVQATGTCS